MGSLPERDALRQPKYSAWRTKSAPKMRFMY